MLHNFSVLSISGASCSNIGVRHGLVQTKKDNLPALKSYSLAFQFKHTEIQKNVRTKAGICCCSEQGPSKRHYKKQEHTQNVDLPIKWPKNKKKPFPMPIKTILRNARHDRKLGHMGIEKQLEAPKNGLVVPDLVPVAYELLDSWIILIKGVAQLMHVIPVHACSECSEVHVSKTGHNIQNCHGTTSSQRKSHHSWGKGSITDILIPIESYHLYDPFGARIRHDTRFNYDRIPALVELCIQAGVDIPEYPSRRRTEPIRILGRKILNRGFVDEPQMQQTPNSSSLAEFDTHRAFERFPAPNSEEEVLQIAEKTLQAYEKVRWGLSKLMYKKYTVKACGYCSEIHVGPWGHNAKLCGEFKHQWRNGKHGWQDATVDEVFPPNYVWHVRDPDGPPLCSKIRRFYGKAPAVVELCVQAGAQVPLKYKPMMRLDIVLPDSDEAFGVV